MKKAKPLVKLLLLILIVTGCQSKEENQTNSLEKTINKYFEAIETRNIEALMKTIDKEKVTLILPNGKLTTSVSDYKQINLGWFNENSWNINYEIVDKTIDLNTAIVLAQITYFDKDEQGADFSFQYYLTLIFRKTNNDWKLIFDQNTIIK